MLLTALVTTITVLGLYSYIAMAYTRPMVKTLYIIRGLPGSGKSTLAAKMAAEKGIKHFEADMFFMVEGVYTFDRFKLMNAHDWCLDSVRTCILLGESVIVSNTFTRWREMREYVDLAQEHGFEVEIIHCVSDFGSIHNVPQEALDYMRDRFIPNEGLPQMKAIKYSQYIPVAEVATIT